MAPTSSGSAWSERAVKPTRSQNNTVTTLRSSSAGRGAAASGAPHAPQNRNPWGLSCPHLEQLAIPAVYGEPLRSTGAWTIPASPLASATASPSVAPHRSCSPWHPISVGCALIIRMIIQTIRLDLSRLSWQSTWQSTSHHQTVLRRSSWIRPLPELHRQHSGVVGGRRAPAYGSGGLGGRIPRGAPNTQGWRSPTG